MQLLTPDFIILPETINLLFLLANGVKQLGIGLFTGQELLNNVLNVGVACRGSNFLERFLKLRGALHLFVHFGFQKRRPKLLSHKVLLHL